MGVKHCPECRHPWESVHLEARPIKALEIAARAFQAARPGLLQGTKRAASPVAQPAPKPRKRKRRTQEQAAGSQPEPALGQDNTKRKATGSPHPGLRHTSPTGAHSDASGSWAPSDEDGNKKPAKRKHSREPVAALTAYQSAPSKASAAQAAATKAAHAPPTPKPEGKLPEGCDRCPICSRVFSIAFLPRHVESCLISADAAAPDSKLAAAAEAQAGAKPVLDLTSSPCAPTSCCSLLHAAVAICGMFQSCRRLSSCSILLLR
jgi:hypothetical protein